MSKRMNGRMAEQLVKEGRVRLKDCRSVKTGKTYDATVVMTTEEDGRPLFNLEFDTPKKEGER